MALPRACLLLVDVQYDFLPGGALAVSDGDQILPHTLQLLGGKFDVFVASQGSPLPSYHRPELIPSSADFHPPHHISFASCHSRLPFTTITVPDLDSPAPSANKTQELWPDHCIQGTHGCELESTVLSQLTALGGSIVQKGADAERDAYSAFAVPTGKTVSPLVDLLERAHFR